MVKFLFVVTCLAGTASARVTPRPCAHVVSGAIPLDASEVQLCTHPEFPGAAGEVIADDGLVHQPIKSVEVNLDRVHKGMKDPTDKGEAFVRDIGYCPAKQDDWVVNGEGVRYQVTDFRPGDVFSGGPRAFFRSDLQCRHDGGEMEIDFSKVGEAALIGEVPIWGVPEELLLTVEAPAESAGLELEIACRAGSYRRRVVGRIREASRRRGRVYQTFSIPGFRDKGWNFAGGIPRSKRFVELVVRRGTAPAKNLRIKPVRLEAVVRAGVNLPPLVAVPPKGDEPPTTLNVGFLNLMGTSKTDARMRVTVSDWSGRELGTVLAPVPPVRPGEREFVQVALPPVKENVNYLSYACELQRDGCRDYAVGGWTTSWTRPLADAGTSEKRPDLPWGFGVYLHRTDGLLSYSSEYAVRRDGDAPFALMEKKAAMAQAMGVKWERAEFQPHVICRDKGTFDFGFYDRLVDCADRHGISLYVIFSHYWPMRGKRRADQHDLTAYAPETYTNWVETLRACVTRYRGRVAGWEIWNEPNIDFWVGPKEDYVKLLNLAYPAVKAADPNARVLACSTAGVDLPFIDKCIGLGATFDDLTIHPYRNDPGESAFLADLAAVTNRSHGTKTWLTELGWPTGCDERTCSERQQAAYFARAYLTAAGSGCCAAINGYDFFDDGFNVLERENNFGIVRRDGTPKPAYRGLAKVFRFFTEGTPALASRKTADGVTIWIFRMGGRSAVWAERDIVLKVRTDGAALMTNLMDEPLGGRYAETMTRVGSLSIAFFDRDVLSAETVVEKKGP